MALLVRLILVLAGTALWYGLAVLGFGGITAFLSHPPLIGLLGVGVLLVVASVPAGGNISSGQREDRGNRWVLVAFTVIGLLDGFLPAWSDRHEVWTFDGDTVSWLGVALTAVGGALRIWPVYVLGYRFSGLVAIQPGHTLVTTGLYRYIRHPSYLGVLVMTGGWALAFRSGIGLVLTALFLPPLIARINAEETLLASYFGAEYDAWRARTSRLLPGIW
jgi:protein-S-isoprenylcysteine O-methyltransferase Ste14